MRRVLVLLCGVMLLGGCGVPGGVEVEGRASQVSPPPPTSTTPSGTPASADAVAVLRADPLLSDKVKSTLAPCEDGYYPIGDRYVDLTGDGVAELVVTLYRCPEAEQMRKAAPQAGELAYGLYGVAAYIYDLATTPPSRLLAVEDGPVELSSSQKDSRQLVLIRSRWGPRDDPCCPTDQTVALYQWDGARFIEVK
ncbi:hypothetical protein [Actinophytocola sp.]|uniref:hypothetical protein n=1 Tax=Actinophytocola sp. TaxID=1872138 RepID=UPI00389A2EE9